MSEETKTGKLMAELPKEIYVTWDGYDDSPEERYLVAVPSLDEFQDGEEIGVYQLVAVKLHKLTRELVDTESD